MTFAISASRSPRIRLRPFATSCRMVSRGAATWSGTDASTSSTRLFGGVVDHDIDAEHRVEAPFQLLEVGGDELDPLGVGAELSLRRRSVRAFGSHSETFRGALGCTAPAQRGRAGNERSRNAWGEEAGAPPELTPAVKLLPKGNVFSPRDGGIAEHGSYVTSSTTEIGRRRTGHFAHET